MTIRVHLRACAVRDVGKQWVFFVVGYWRASQFAAFIGNSDKTKAGVLYKGKYASSMAHNGGMWTEHPQYRGTTSELSLTGVVHSSPRTGLLYMGFPAVRLVDNVLLSTELHVRHTDLVLRNNLLLPNMEGEGFSGRNAEYGRCAVRRTLTHPTHTLTSVSLPPPPYITPCPLPESPKNA